MANGAVVKATMRPGAAGFAEAIFPDEPDVVIATEMPNLALPEFYPPVGKRPAATLKRPAAAGAGDGDVSDVLGPSEEEEEEEEPGRKGGGGGESEAKLS